MDAIHVKTKEEILSDMREEMRKHLGEHHFARVMGEGSEMSKLAEAIASAMHDAFIERSAQALSFLLQTGMGVAEGDA
jgi:hypothetical protein